VEALPAHDQAAIRDRLGLWSDLGLGTAKDDRVHRVIQRGQSLVDLGIFTTKLHTRAVRLFAARHQAPASQALVVGAAGLALAIAGITLGWRGGRRPPLSHKRQPIPT